MILRRQGEGALRISITARPCDTKTEAVTLRREPTGVWIIAQGDDGFQGHVTSLDGPFVGLLQEGGADEMKDGRIVRKYPDDNQGPLIANCPKIGATSSGRFFFRRRGFSHLAEGAIRLACACLGLGVLQRVSTGSLEPGIELRQSGEGLPK